MTESPRHDLDDPIDRVAAKMVAVEGDGDVMARMMTQLPERGAPLWFMAWPMQLAAGFALVLLAFVWARPLGSPATSGAGLVAQPPEPTARLEVAIAEPPSLRVDVRVPGPGSLLRQGYGGKALIPEDHERSLAPVDAIDPLELDGIAPMTMELDAAASLEPLVLTDLVLDLKGDQ